MTRWSRCLIVVALVCGSGCARAADEARLQEDLQRRLDTEVKADLLKVVALTRQGSAPLPAGESGNDRVIVYFNTTLRLAQDYAFGEWDHLGASSVAFALGATEKGIFGVQPQNRTGDLVRAYGSAVYEATGDGWRLVAGTPVDPAAATAAADGTTPPPRSKQLIDRLAAMVNLPPPGVPPQQEDIIAEELERASEAIERRVRRRDHVFTLATGPADGEYARFGASLAAAVNTAATVKLRERPSEGSVENVLLLSRGEADYAIVQGDVAAAAAAGTDLFARGAPLANLRAVGGLFPEAVHVVVLPDSPIKEITDLKGKRVDIGTPASGTRFDAVAVLDAYGLAPGQLAEAREDGPIAAAARLRRRQIDAMFVTAAAPLRVLQRLAVDTGLRLVPIHGAAIGRLVEARPGLTPLTLPPNTYPRQQAPVTTVASAALLLTTVEAPTAEVERVAELVFRRLPQQGAGTAGAADVLKVSAENELRGVTIPLHPGAARPAP